MKTSNNARRRRTSDPAGGGRPPEVAIGSPGKVRGDADAKTEAEKRAAIVPSAEEFVALVRRAEQGDHRAMAELRPFFELAPEAWDMFDMAEHVQAYWLQRAVRDDLVRGAALKHEAEELRRELAGPDPDALEQLLIERIVATRLQVLHAELAYARAANPTVRQAEFFIKRMDRAQKRHVDAIKALAQVRRLLVPAIQINIAEQQVNVAAADLGRAALPQVLR